jgi:hypothetical protein
VWLKNLSLKLTALGLALLLWFHVATNHNYDYAVDLALAPGSLPEGFTLAQPVPDNVRVLLRGTGKELIRLIWNNGHARLLLEPWTTGAHLVSPERILMRVDADVTIEQVLEPPLFTVQIDTVVEREVTVRFQGEYATAAKFSLVRSPVVEPQTVILSGPRSVVDRLVTVGTEPVEIELLTQSHQQSAALDLGDVFNVTAVPDTVQVHFEVAPSLLREIEGVHVQVPRGWRTDPPTVTLSIAGAEARLDRLSPSAYRVTVSPELLEPDALVSVEATVPPLVEILTVTPAQVRAIRR